MNELQRFWAAAYVAALKGGKSGLSACGIADNAVLSLVKRGYTMGTNEKSFFEEVDRGLSK